MRTPSQTLMARETRTRLGVVPHRLNDRPLGVCGWQLVGDAFLLRGEGEHYFHYRKGEGVTIERGPGAVIEEEGLWLAGSVHAAIASINGLLPIHASAVAFGGRVFAFTGPSGAGKSTLIAELGQRGLPMFCDDTLVLDLSDPDRVLCLPGHKRLKLTDEALALTGAVREEPVGGDTPKHYARPPAGDVDTVLPLDTLVFLEEGEPARIVASGGSEAMRMLRDDHYTTWLFHAATRPDRASEFARLARLARQVSVARFIRPRDPARFGDDAALVDRYVRQQP